MCPVSDVAGRGGASPTHHAGGAQSPLVLDRPTYILWDHRVAPGGSNDPQFGGVQNRPHRALNIDFLHAKDGRGSDQWFPQTFQRSHRLWATRWEQLYQVVPSTDPGPTADFIRWWILAGNRYLVPEDLFHRLPPEEIPIEAVQRQSAPHPPRPDVPDNKRPVRRMMVGTRTTARDWQWLDDALAEDAPAAPPTQRNRRMPVRYGCWRGAGRPRRGGRAGKGCGEEGDAAPTQQTQGGASTSRAAFLDALHSPGFEQLISDMTRDDGSAYRPDMQFDGSPVHLDLNEPMSGPSHLFMALVSAAPTEQPGEPATPGRARRAPRRRGCGTGGHM
ncbi:hypothetical protein PIB30_057555 [Stylosanthes scabra]|uniref:Aminotransferase-like plant mobile domain-containing protein n=1 Tax=Stylosanthes scabra TaxID=79078 RepID=A0ABU6XK32_9FABA|nr:hypothetical protein [Stylosanthes scabra]